MAKLFLLLNLVIIGCSVRCNANIGLPKDSVLSDSLIVFGKSFLGTPYKYAICNPKVGFDCSGFVYYVFNHFNIKVPRSSIDYMSVGKDIAFDSCMVGDIIVFTGTNAKNRRAGHVGMIVSKLGDEMQFIHSSSNTKNGGVKLSTFKESPYYKKRFLKIVRVTKVY
jgi:murein DD-endopeptidase / murein LD-carboxypeptidase